MCQVKHICQMQVKRIDWQVNFVLRRMIDIPGVVCLYSCAEGEDPNHVYTPRATSSLNRPDVCALI